MHPMHPKQLNELDPSDPRDALALLSAVTAALTGTREDHRRMMLAVDTLARLIPADPPPPSNLSPE
jgi:hypothetical protein